MNSNGIRGLDSNELKFGEKMLQEIAAQLADLVDQLADLVDSSEGLEMNLKGIDQKLAILEAACIKWVPREPEEVWKATEPLLPTGKKKKRS